MRLKNIITRNELAFLRIWIELFGDLHDTIDIGVVAALVESGDIERLLGSLGYVEENFSRLDDPLRDAYVSAGRAVVPSLGPLQGRSASSFEHRTPRATALLNELSRALTGRVVIDGREGVASVTAGYPVRGARELALDLAGRYDKVEKRRIGGLVGLNASQMDWVQGVRNKLTTPQGMREYLRLDLRDRRYDPTIKKAMEEGFGLSQEYINTVVGRYSDRTLHYRGRTIAQTQITQAANAGAYESVRQKIEGGKIENVRKRWRTRGDNNVRHSHTSVNGQEVGFSELFTTSRGYRLAYPGDLSNGADLREIVSCRCELEYLYDHTG